METRATRRPGEKGTRKLAERYGDRLLYVRYRYDRETNTRVTTVELIVDRRPAAPPSPCPTQAVAPPRTTCLPRALDTEPTSPCEVGATRPRTLGPGLVALRIKAQETALRQKVKSAGGYWDPNLGLWVPRVDRASALGLACRLVVTGS